MDFSDKLKTILEQEKVSLKELGRQTKIPYSTLVKYSKGSFEPSLAQIKKIINTERFNKYRNLLLQVGENEPISYDVIAPAIKEPSVSNEDFTVLWNLVCEAGKEDQALEYLTFLAAQQDKT